MLKPLGDRVTIEVAKKEEKTIGGIVLASAVREKLQTGTVVVVGEDCLSENSEEVPVAVKVGDQVMFKKHVSTEVEYEGKEYLIVAEKDTMTIAE